MSMMLGYAIPALLGILSVARVDDRDTPLIPERITINKQALQLFTLPLESKVSPPPPGLQGSAIALLFAHAPPARECPRRYVGSWAIQGDSLFLTGLEDCGGKAIAILSKLAKVDE